MFHANIQVTDRSYCGFKKIRVLIDNGLQESYILKSTAE